MADQDPIVLSEEPGSVRINLSGQSKKTSGIGGKMVKKEQKIPFVDRVISSYCGKDVNRQNLGEYILKERLEPIGMRMLNNGIQSILKRTSDAAQMMIFGKVINNSQGPTDYTSFSNPNGGNVPKPGGYRVSNQVDVFAFTDRRKAEECLAYLRGRIREYGSAGVLDYFEWINSNLQMDIPLDYNMTNQGWVDLSSCTVKPDPNGFIIDLPRPILLKRG